MRHLELEDAFDADRLSESKFGWPEARLLLERAQAGAWKDVYALTPEALRSAASAAERGFVLQIAVGAAETEYNVEARAGLLKLWREIPDWALDPYCQHVHALQDGLTHFFAGALRDASLGFQRAWKIAAEHGYARGMMKASFHLGLVAAESKRAQEARRHFETALRLATEREAGRYRTRVASELAKLGASEEPAACDLLAEAKRRIEHAMASADFQKARRDLLEAERQRRRQGLRRGRESLGGYLALLHLGLGRLESGRRILSRIADPVLRLRFLELKRDFLHAEAAELAEIRLLQESLGISKVVASAGEQPDWEIAGVPIMSIKDEVVRNFLRKLVENGHPWPKARIVREVWGLEYDPVIHDRKVYNLIQKCKRLLGIPQLFLNTYGSYEIHPELLGRAPLRRCD